MHARSLRRVWLVAVVLLALACDAPSEIVIVVDAEPGLELDELTIEARSTESPQTAELDLREASAPAAPWTLGLSAPGGTPLFARVIGTTRTGDTVEARARTTFVAGERRLLHLHLASACVGVDCGEGTTCDPEAACVSDEREACPYREPLPIGPPQPCEPGADAGPADAGVSDGGRDGGPDAGAIDGGMADGGTLPLPRPTLCDTGTCQVAAGARHACALDAAGLVRCWGSNDDGELGRDGAARGRAVEILGLADVRDVAAGEHFTCALTASDDVRCWGRNDAAQLGAPSSTLARSSTPRVVPFPSGAPPVALSAGGGFACALLADRTVACWGDNRARQLDRDTIEESHEPQRVTLDFLAEGVSAGGRHACAWGQGVGRCWGTAPAGMVASARRVIAMAAGDAHTCAIVDTDGSVDVLCWGDNRWAQSGAGSVVVPFPISVGTPAVEITAGADHTCARLDDGTRRCWGYNEHDALAVDAPERIVAAPSLGIGPIASWRQLAAGDRFTCGIDDAREVYCWGWDLAGAVGQDAPLHPGPTDVSMASGAIVADLSAGGAHACALIDDALRCWGSSAFGQLGLGFAPPAISSAAELDIAWTPTAIAAGGAHTCALSDDQRVRCWGSNSRGQLARIRTMVTVDTPGVTLELPIGVAEVTAGGEHTCALADDAGTPRLQCWGRGDDGQLGSGVVDSHEPLAAAADVHGASAGAAHTCAIDDGSLAVSCWGRSDDGRIGTATPSDRDAGFPASTMVAAGSDFTCALLDTDQVQCVGAGARGQLGNGLTAMSETPVGVGLTNLVGVTAGAAHACAWSTSSVSCWGANERGQAGGTPGADVVTPVALSLGAGTVERVEAGDVHTCAVVSDGGTDRVVCWGSDEDGRLGSGRALVVGVPSRVMEGE